MRGGKCTADGKKLFLNFMTANFNSIIKHKKVEDLVNFDVRIKCASATVGDGAR
jgi:hypothetical protein